MNVKPEQMAEACYWIGRAKKVVVDTESNTLNTRQPENLISISVYLPEFDKTYNFAFRYGVGQVEVKWTKTNPLGTGLIDMNWSGNTKKRAFLKYWYDVFRETREPEYFENLPLSCIDQLKAVWGLPGVTYIFHNFRFDGHILEYNGFPRVWKVEDTMIALHIVEPGWRSTTVKGPYEWTKEDAKAGRCKPEMVGRWARDDKGELLKKPQPGNRGLKWQSAFHGFKDATTGEELLHEAISFLTDELAAFIVEQPETYLNKPPKPTKTGKVRVLPRPTIDEIKDKLVIDDKAHMWMLPSSKVARYAELDVELTWQLREWCMKIMDAWGNLPLWEDMCNVHYHVAWEMEVNGFKLDRAQAEAEIAKLDPRIKDVEKLLEGIASKWGFKELGLDEEEDEDEAFRVSSNKELKHFLNSGVLGQEFDKTIFPSWWVIPEEGLELKTYKDAFLTKTDAEELEKYEYHPIIKLVREYRRMKKSSDTYLKKWVKAADYNDIVRFNMNVDGTDTGRMSSGGEAGNGQNIPERKGYTIKRAIKSYGPKWLFWAGDYGQLELRLASWVAETLLGLDPNKTMTNLFLSGEDMHSYVRDMIGIRDILYPNMTDEQIIVKLGYDVGSKEVEERGGAKAIIDDKCRQIAKTCNFGLTYNGTEYMLQRQIKQPLEDCKIIVTKWKNMFPAFGRAQRYYQEQALTRRPLPGVEAMDQGLFLYVTQPISNRHRKLHMIPTRVEFEKDGRKQWFNAREATADKTWNFVVQGLGGYLCTVGLYNYFAERGKDMVKLFAQIHDAADGFIHIDHLEEAKLIAHHMTNWPQIVPGLTLDMQGSPSGNWQDMKKIVDVDLWIDSKGTLGYPVPKTK